MFESGKESKKVLPADEPDADFAEPVVRRKEVARHFYVLSKRDEEKAKGYSIGGSVGDKDVSLVRIIVRR